MADEIEVEGPDGEIFAFPAGTSDAVMRTALIRHYQGPAKASPKPAEPAMPGFVDEFGRTGLPSSEEIRAAGGAVDAGVRSLANGATLGLADRFAAAMGALTGVGGRQGDYAGNLTAQQTASKQAGAEHPVASLGGELVGAAALPVGVAGAAMKAASLPAKAAVGGAVGAGVGAAQGALSAPDLTQGADVAQRAALGGGAGLIIGGAMPVAARGLGAAYRAATERGAAGATDDLGRPATDELVRAVRADGPEAVQQSLGGLGAQGMLADAGPSLTGVAQGLAVKPGDAKSALVGALAERNAGVNDRLQAAVTDALGPAESPVARTAALKAQRSAETGPMFREAFASAPPVDALPIVAAIGQNLNKAVGPERAGLQQVVQMLRETGPGGAPAWASDAEKLHGIKVAIDGMIDYGAPGLGIAPGSLSKAEGALKAVRGRLNDLLREKVPGYAAANDASAAFAREAAAVETGTSLLDGGKAALRPDDLAARLAGMTPNERAGLAVGSRAEIDRAVGTKANDLAALRQVLQGDGGWNTQKLGLVHGDEAARRVVDAVTREGRMRDTYGKVVENSQTAQRTASAKALADADAPKPPLSVRDVTPLGLTLAPFKWAAGKAWEAATRPDNAGRDTQLARALALQGDEAAGLLSALLAASQRRTASDAKAAAVGERAAIAAGLLGSAGLQHQLGKR